MSDQNSVLSGNSARVFTVHSVVPFPKVVAQHLVEHHVDTVVVPRHEDAVQLRKEILKLAGEEREMDILPFTSIVSSAYFRAKDELLGALLLCMQFVEEWNRANSKNYPVDWAWELLLAHDEVCLNCVDRGKLRASLLAGEFSDKGSVALEMFVGFEDWCRLNDAEVFFQGYQEKVESYVEDLRLSQRKVAVAGTLFNGLFINFLKLLLEEVNDSQVILPFIDLELPHSKWKSLDHSHCQYYVMKLLSTLKVDRGDVKCIGSFNSNILANLLFNHELAGPHFASGCGIEAQNNVELMTFGSESNESHKIAEIIGNYAKSEPAIRNTDLVEPHSLGSQRSGDVNVIGKAGSEANTKVDQLDIYGALDAPCVLFLESDSLANRVRSELWISNTESLTGDCCYMARSLIMCVLEVINSGGEAVALLSALKHPMVSLECSEGDYAAVLSEFELTIIRENAASGFDMISKIVALGDTKFTRFWEIVIGAFSPLLQLNNSCTLEKMSQEHLNCLKNLMVYKPCKGALLSDAESKIHDFFCLLKSHCRQVGLFSIANYSSLVQEASAHFFRDKCNDINSAFFVASDAIMVSGFNEGAFTKLTRSFLFNDEVRRGLGLPSVEEYCGYFAYIIYGILHAKKVYITRSEESCGQVSEAPLMVRYLDFLLSSFAVKGKDDISANEESSVSVPINVEANVPNPPLEVRREVFSEITTEAVDVLLNNPFAFYARYILGMRFVNRIDVGNVAKSFSRTVRRILSQYLEQVGLSNDYRTLIDIARKEFCAISEHYPYVEDLWWPRFEKMARGFLKTDSERKRNISRISIGETFTWNVGRNVKVISKCDRVEYSADGGVSVICHKVGTIPSQIDIRCGLASRGVVDSISVVEGRSDLSNVSFEYWKIVPESVEITAIEGFADILENARSSLGSLLRAYSEEMIPFHPRVDFSRFAEYELFSRIGEQEINLTMRR